MSTSPVSQICVPLSELYDLTEAYFKQGGLASWNIPATVTALIEAESVGENGHGVMRAPFYVKQIRSGKVNGTSRPESSHPTPIITQVNAQHGLAFPALEQGIAISEPVAKKWGTALLSICCSHHSGMMGHWTEMAAKRDLISLFFSNSPSAIAPWNGKRALFGTNPIAFGVPRVGKDPIIIDLSLSKVARGKIMAAKQAGETIPLGIALDPKGHPTNDPTEAIAGSMLPIGDAKGAALVLMVEIFSALLTQAHFSHEASSFFEAEGSPPGVGQFALFLSPPALGIANYSERLEILLEAILAQKEEPSHKVRLPGSQRSKMRQNAKENGLKISKNLYEELKMGIA